MGRDHGQEAVESAAVFLFEIFYNKDHVGTEETRAIKHMFGPFPSSGAQTSCCSVARLVASLGDSHVDALVQSCRRAPRRAPAFGRNIAFSFECYPLDPLEDLSSSGVHQERDGLDFMNFLNVQQSGRKAAEKEGAVPSGASLTPGDENLLRSEVEKYLSGGNMISSSPEELCTSLFEMLASQRSDDELQNEVCLRGGTRSLFQVCQDLDLHQKVPGVDLVTTVWPGWPLALPTSRPAADLSQVSPTVAVDRTGELMW